MHETGDITRLSQIFQAAYVAVIAEQNPPSNLEFSSSTKEYLKKFKERIDNLAKLAKPEKESDWQYQQQMINDFLKYILIKDKTQLAKLCEESPAFCKAIKEITKNTSVYNHDVCGYLNALSNVAFKVVVIGNTDSLEKKLATSEKRNNLNLVYYSRNRIENLPKNTKAVIIECDLNNNESVHDAIILGKELWNLSQKDNLYDVARIMIVSTNPNKSPLAGELIEQAHNARFGCKILSTNESVNELRDWTINEAQRFRNDQIDSNIKRAQEFVSPKPNPAASSNQNSTTSSSPTSASPSSTSIHSTARPGTLSAIAAANEVNTAQENTRPSTTKTRQRP